VSETAPLLFKVEITAEGEVRDKDGVLLSTTPVHSVMELTADQLTELGLPVPPHPQEK
jgi:hypothetical protein